MLANKKSELVAPGDSAIFLGDCASQEFLCNSCPLSKGKSFTGKRMLENVYQESVEQSGNVLRMVLQHIAGHKLPYNPITYAVWYEHAAGRNPDLSRELQELEQKKIVYEQVIRLFRQYIAENQFLRAETNIRHFQKILAEIAEQFWKSGVRLDEHDTTFKNYAGELSRAKSMEDIAQIAQKILMETKDVIESTRSLKDQLEATTEEIQALRKEIEGIKQTAVTDMLTGLSNRRGLDEILPRDLDKARENQTPMVIALMDIDHFKRVNDEHGHLIGDNVLKMLAQVLKNHIKGKDTAARFGGEEFLLVLPETRLDGARILIEQIRKTLGNMKWVAKDTRKSIGLITVSTGIAQYRDGESIEDFIKRADNSLYFAKETGRNRTVAEDEVTEGFTRENPENL